MSGPTEEQIREAERTGVLLWKEIQDIEHIKDAVPDDCKCSLNALREHTACIRGAYALLVKSETEGEPIDVWVRGD
jgi:hypothetical protein